MTSYLPIKYSINIISRSTDPFFTNERSLKSGEEGGLKYDTILHFQFTIELKIYKSGFALKV